MKILLPTLGSSGDVHPFIALGAALQARGHRATLLTNPIFQQTVEQEGLGFLPVGSAESAQAIIANPDVWHLRKGFALIAQVLLPAMSEIYGLIERHATQDTVVAYSTLAFGARLAQEKLGVPSASVHLQPSVIRSLSDQGMFGNVRLSPSQPRWFKKALFRLVDALVLDSSLKRPLNAMRRRLGLSAVDRVMHAWMHSPQLVIGFFPNWYAPVQPDWPANTHAVGFPLWDGRAEASELSAAEEFLAAGEPPIIFTAGTAASTMESFFQRSIEVARALGMRAMLVTNFPQQVSSRLPAGIKVFRYLPFSQILPRASLLVHHGGIGTTAQGIKAGVPHLIVPHGYDQFDNAWRIERLALGRRLTQTNYRGPQALKVIRELLQRRDGPDQRRLYRAKIDSAAALCRACELIEALQPES